MHGPTPDLIKTSVTKTTTPEQYNAASRRYRKELQRNRGRRNSKCTNFWSNATDGYVVSRARANLLVVHGRVRPSVRPRSMDGPWTVLSSAHLWRGVEVKISWSYPEAMEMRNGDRKRSSERAWCKGKAVRVGE